MGIVSSKGAVLIATILIYSALMGCLTLAVLRWPATALAAILCTYAVEQWAQSNSLFFISHRAFTNYVTGVILLLGLAVMILRGQRIFMRYPSVGWATLALYGFAMMSVIWSVYRGGSISHWKSHLPYVVTVVGLCPLLIVHPQDLRIGFFATLVMGSIVLLLLYFMAERSGRTVVLMGGSLGLGEKGGNPLAVASLAGYVVLIAVLMNFQGVGRIWQLWRWVVVAIGLVLSIKSGSRGQLIAMTIAALAFLPISRRIATLRGFVATFAGVLIVGAMVAWLFGRFATAERWEWESMVETYQYGRLAKSETLLRALLASSPIRWIIGLGSSASFDPKLLGSYPHVVMTEVLGEEGLIGFGLFCAIIAMASRSIIRVYRVAAPYADARGVLASLGALFFFELMLSFKQGSLLGSTYLFAFAIMLGIFEQCVSQQIRQMRQLTSANAAASSVQVVRPTG